MCHDRQHRQHKDLSDALKMKPNDLLLQRTLFYYPRVRKLQTASQILNLQETRLA